jgi:hypothetical protein
MNALAFEPFDRCVHVSNTKPQVVEALAMSSEVFLFNAGTYKRLNPFKRDLALSPKAQALLELTGLAIKYPIVAFVVRDWRPAEPQAFVKRHYPPDVAGNESVMIDLVKRVFVRRSASAT